MFEQIALAVGQEPSASWGFAQVNDLARDTGWLQAPLLAYAGYGVALFAVLLLAGWWTARGESSRTMAAALWAAAGTLVAVAVNQPIVDGIHEARPYTTHPGILVLAHRSSDYSFPSDHAVMAGAVATGLWLVSRRLGTIAALAALLMAFVRVYIGAHYPQDVLVGLALGAGVIVIGWLLVRAALEKLVRLLRRTPLRLLVGGGEPPERAPDDRRNGVVAGLHPENHHGTVSPGAGR